MSSLVSLTLALVATVVVTKIVLRISNKREIAKIVKQINGE